MNLELKIKMENKKEVVLDEKEARELFAKLKEIFGNKEKEYVPYYPYWKYWNYEPFAKPYYTTWTTTNTDGAEWKSSNGSVTINNAGVK